MPGANDNLTGVSALVALAQALQQQPVEGLRVMLVSCGAEETLQDGIRAFVARHDHELPPDRTSFINLDQVGSPNMAMLEAEGPIWMEEYPGAWLRDEVDAEERLTEPADIAAAIVGHLRTALTAIEGLMEELKPEGKASVPAAAK